MFGAAKQTVGSKGKENCRRPKEKILQTLKYYSNNFKTKNKYKKKNTKTKTKEKKKERNCFRFYNKEMCCHFKME